MNDDQDDVLCLAVAILPAIDEIYARHPAGCCLHLVLDDGNVNDGSVEFCIGVAERNGHPDCIAIARMLAKMSRTQRAKLGKLHR